MTQVIGVIPARWASVRFPGKILADISGKPLIQWVWERASQARKPDILLVATDDERIAEAVRAFGGKPVMTRPDHPSGTDRIAEVVQDLEGDVIINIQGDEPVIDPELIDEVAGALVDDPEWDMATAAAPIRGAYEQESPSVVKVVWGEYERALYFSRRSIPYVRDPGEMESAGRPTHWRHIGLYGYRRHFLERLTRAPVCPLEQAEKLEQLRALYIGARMKVIKSDTKSVGVDSPNDIERVENVLRQAGLV